MVADGWYTCPTCGKRLRKVPPGSIMFNMPVWCRTCKVEWFPSIFNGREFVDDEPFPLLIQNK